MYLSHYAADSAGPREMTWEEENRVQGLKEEAAEDMWMRNDRCVQEYLLECGEHQIHDFPAMVTLLTGSAEAVAQAADMAERIKTAFVQWACEQDFLVNRDWT